MKNIDFDTVFLRDIKDDELNQSSDLIDDVVLIENDQDKVNKLAKKLQIFYSCVKSNNSNYCCIKIGLKQLKKL